MIVSCLLAFVLCSRAQNSAHVPFVLDHRQVVIPVSLNGKSGYHFLVDTGAGGGGMINDETAKALHLRVVDHIQIGDPSGRNVQQVPIYRLPELEIGGLKFTNLNMALSLEGRRDTTDGVLGLDAYRSMLLKIDYPHKLLTITPDGIPSEIAHGALQLHMGNGIYSTEISVAGHSWRTHVDTGSSGGILLPKPLYAQLKFIGEKKIVGHASTPFNSFDIYAAKLNGDIAIGGLVLHDPMVECADMFPVVNIGGRFLVDCVLYLDQRSKQLALVKP
jgi:predicted aspartyl protease